MRPVILIIGSIVQIKWKFVHGQDSLYLFDINPSTPNNKVYSIIDTVIILVRIIGNMYFYLLVAYVKIKKKGGWEILQLRLLLIDSTKFDVKLYHVGRIMCQLLFFSLCAYLFNEVFQNYLLGFFVIFRLLFSPGKITFLMIVILKRKAKLTKNNTVYFYNNLWL